MGLARNGTGLKWDTRARNGMGPKWDGPEMGHSEPKWDTRNRNGMGLKWDGPEMARPEVAGPKWVGPKWPGPKWDTPEILNKSINTNWESWARHLLTFLNFINAKSMRLRLGLELF